jgi:hypothetical protein
MRQLKLEKSERNPFATGFIMRHNLSPQKNLAVLFEAFRGKPAALREYRRSLKSPVTIETGLTLLLERWPGLRSSNQSTPIFIFSAGWRSGSTFLQRWIMTGKNILVWGEPYRHSALIPSLAGQLKAFTQQWPKDHFFAACHGHDDDLTNTWVANLYPDLTDFMDAHIGYFENLFSKPALAAGKSGWGLKEVTLRVEHACYLQWLFPNAKFLFLYRDPYRAYGSYRNWRDWYRTWPDEPVFTAARFGALWKELAADFLQNHHKTGGLLLRYEELQTQATKSRLEDYLGFELKDAASLVRVGDASARDRPHDRSHWIPKLEGFLLKRQVEPVSRQLGYCNR